MTSKKGVTAECVMRCGGRIATLTHLWSLHEKGLRRPVGICDRCGHVQHARPFEPSEYVSLNVRIFGSKYTAATKEDRASDRERKLRATLRRLAPVLDKKGGSLLDVGAGEGWSHQVAEHFGLRYHVVEAQPELARRLEDLGGVIAAGTIQQLLPRWSGQFEVVILRHVLEHLLDPIGDLHALKQCLAPDGLLYLALPNFTKAQLRGNFRTDFLSPQHISYFTPNKLEWCLHQAGLRADSVHDEGELWAITEPGIATGVLQDERDENRRHFIALMRAKPIRDIRHIIRIVGLRLTARFPRPVYRTISWIWRALPFT